eukprot:1358466-Ditylum_brightwellii.AAC.1
MMHQEHHIGGEGGGGDMGGAMVWQKGESWVVTGDPNFCTLKPMQWLQRAQTSPNIQKGQACRYLPWGWLGQQER